ncbi:right-handed parallel beta-helix repeat-containing protein [Marinifilum fragile]|uniref:right-handed parallel beta-helix repeat-containing protein n=1 Tax=Marinifilum fragile TaxID=570161 RepID=UPI002AAC09E8|nr:right-handed parallel beta-helix repeat-containing protein [Marinifilum fragile]
MRVERKVIAIIMILSMWCSFASCDDEFVEDQNPTEEVDTNEDVNNGDDSTGDNTSEEGNTEEGNSSDDTSKDGNRTTIENKVFNETLIIDGHENDSLLIKNCTFENIDDIALVIKTVDELIIRDCIFRNLNSHAIFLQAGQNSNNITIEGNEIYDVAGIGIFAGEGHTNTKCINNKIHDVAFVDVEGHTPHGIYLCGKNFLIEDNTIYNCGSLDGKGLGISVRSYGTISKNKIYNGRASGIAFSSDHPAFNGNLLIENNVIFDNYENAITLYLSNEDSPLGNITVRFNTMLSDNKPVVYANSWKSLSSELVSYGNILIRTDGDDTYIDSSSSNPFSEMQNLYSSKDIGFIDFDARNFHLKSNAEALNFATGINDFPEFDKENNRRNSSGLDAGAYEYK